jgi:endonuclease/exonuclease/phosphatase family metal-dependent hydrolase
MGDLNSGTPLAEWREPNNRHKRVVDALTGLGLVSAYNAFHRLEHGQETHATYFHQFDASQPWHIDFCFIPRAWASKLVNVTVINGEPWAKRSDHRPLFVEIALS